MTNKEQTCEERIDAQLKRIITGIKALRKSNLMDSDDWVENLEENEHISVLSLDYVYPHTFNDQQEGITGYNSHGVVQVMSLGYIVMKNTTQR